jgi:hypothetical protein
MAPLMAGNNNAARMAIIPITTNNSTNVKPRPFFRNILLIATSPD